MLQEAIINTLEANGKTKNLREKKKDIKEQQIKNLELKNIIIIQ